MIEFVSDAVREIAREETLGAIDGRRPVDVTRKPGGEPVTAVDIRLEKRLIEAVSKMRPNDMVVGEETAHNAAAVRARAGGADDVWLIDPLDGTENFIAGKPDFAVMLCLLRDGDPVAAWIYLPASDRMAVAERGAGAFIDGRRMCVLPPPADITAMIGEIHDRFLPESLRSDMKTARAKLPRCAPRNCAGVTYTDLAVGKRHFALYYRIRPWDHAAGILICGEAGGTVARFDGSPYRVFDKGEGLLVAPDPESWRQLRDFLLPGYER